MCLTGRIEKGPSYNFQSLTNSFYDQSHAFYAQSHAGTAPFPSEPIELTFKLADPLRVAMSLSVSVARHETERKDRRRPS